MQGKGNKIRPFSQKTTWLGREITERGTKPNKENIKAVLKPKPPTSCKGIKYLLDITLILHKFSEKLNPMRQLLRKKWEQNWTENEEEGFNEIRKKITEKPLLGYFARD